MFECSAGRFMRRQGFAVLAAARLAFVAAQGVVMWGVFTKSGGQVDILPWDKAEHFLAFLGLMLLALPAFPAGAPVALALALAVEGGLIELVQATPMIHRDADLGDWVADVAGVLTVVAALVAHYVRLQLKRETLAGPGTLLSVGRAVQRW